MKRVLLIILGLLVAFVALPPLYFAAVPAESKQLPAPGRRLDVRGGIAVNAIDEGHGTPIILVCDVNS